MIQVEKEEYINWKSSEPTLHLIEYINQLKNDFMDAVGEGRYPEGSEMNRAIGNYQMLQVLLSYILHDFQYSKEEKVENADQSGRVSSSY